MKVKLKDVRLAFPALFQAKTINGEGDPRFSATFLLEKNSANAKAIENAINQVAKDKWDDKAEAILKGIRTRNAVCLHDGAEKAEYDGFDGKMYVSASNSAKPKILDRDKTELIQVDGKPYGGCYVNAVIDIWAQDNKYGKRINASLMGVQFFRDGDAFAGGGVASEDDFEDLGVDENDTDLV
ncbi:DUF2815 family protein [Pasteurella atlantica]|uniref:DUF2815 family protein n=2 Tax=Pasteurellaceae TaxID=712 RepID=A0ACC6HJH3_9PAST|nr:DUF2815 family protein [Pasteurella atlantica]MDP8051027.1 DUF2815 family protein [Pasteurella atlantica]MDP8104323.1 DUF2815 family protein [Pasteurella atlantica]MDP8147683.1 DUF2815 family protein [Pasteurella atlantica]